MISTLNITRIASFALIAVILSGLSACNGDDDAKPEASDQPSASADALDVPADVFERSCRSQVEGGSVERLPPRIRNELARGALVVGPVTFSDARNFATPKIEPAEYSANRPPGTWGQAWKSVTEVEPNVSATVVIPARYRDSILLIYRRFASSKGGFYSKSAGDAAVRFAACPPPPEGRSHAFNGGFLVKKAGCYEIEVLSDQDSEPQRATIGFAVGREGCPGDP